MFGQYSAGYQGRLTKSAMLASAAREHDGAAIVDARKVANNTLAYTVRDELGGGWRIIRHFQTDILAEATDSPLFTVHLGGWNSLTTRDRLRCFLPGGWSVWTDQGTPWLHHRPSGKRWPLDANEPATFNRATGSHVSGKLADQVEEKRIKVMLRDFIAKARRGDFADPAGDPWLFSPEPPARDTLIDWLEGGYVTRAALCRALQWAGYGDTAIGMALADLDRGRQLPPYGLNTLRRWIKRGLDLD